MESTSLGFMKPGTALTIKRIPIDLAPQRRASASASAWKHSRKMGKAIAVKAMEKKVGMAEEVEKELQKEGYLEWREMDKCKECGEEEGGMVELMECLEKEAIMGEDEGKDPIDYNRRAHIFDNSSKIFQL